MACPGLRSNPAPHNVKRGDHYRHKRSTIAVMVVNAFQNPHLRLRDESDMVFRDTKIARCVLPYANSGDYGKQQRIMMQRIESALESSKK